MDKSRILYALCAVVVLFLLGLAGHIYFTPDNTVVDEEGVYDEPRLIYENVEPYNEPVRRFRRLLGDQQDVQLPAAQALGIEPQSNKHLFDSLVDARRLLRIGDSKYIDVHADYPYLIPEAYDLLLEIGRRYQQRTDSTQQLKVTSCLRTFQSIKRSRNVNKVPHSCHLYGTTFDISYRDMEYPQKVALAQTLKELRDAGYLYAIYERKQPCFHITLRAPGRPKETK